MVKQNYGLAVLAASRFRNTNKFEMEDLVQFALIGLLKAIRGFDPDRGAKFSTYAMYCCWNEILKKLRKNQLPVFNIECSGSYSEPQPLWEYLPVNLTDVERNIITMKADGVSNADISRSLCMSKGGLKSHLVSAYSKIEEANIE